MYDYQGLSFVSCYLIGQVDYYSIILDRILFEFQNYELNLHILLSFALQQILYSITRSNSKMEIGTSVGIFLAIAVVLMALFCIITKYFQYRMNQMAEQKGQQYSQVDQMISHNSDEDIQGQYDEFLEKRKQQKEQSLSSSKKKRQQAYLFQTTEVEEPMRDPRDPMHGVGMLRRRLDGEAVQQPEMSGRSVPSIKSFRPQRLQTGRSNLSSDRPFPLFSNAKPIQQPLTIHDYISKLVSYTQQGIFILEVGMISLTKQGGRIKQKTIPNTIIINPLQSGFEDHLQVLGFESKHYNCMKYKITAEIPYMQQNHEYMIGTLKTSQSKEEINFSQYYMLKDKIQSAME